MPAASTRRPILLSPRESARNPHLPPAYWSRNPRNQATIGHAVGAERACELRCRDAVSGLGTAKAGRRGSENRAARSRARVAVAVVLRMAMTLSAPKIGARDLAALSREFTNQVRALGLLPTASSNGDLETLLRELRG